MTTKKPNLISREEIAEAWGIEPESVRSTMRRYGLTEVRGYDRAAFEKLKKVGQGTRTDLLRKPARRVTRAKSADSAEQTS